MNNPFHVLHDVDAYLHDLLTPREAEHLERHCSQCPVCEAALAEARKRLQALESVPACEAREHLVQQTLTAIRTRDQALTRQRKWLYRGLGAAVAAAVLLLGGLHIYFLNLAPSPYELTVLGQNQLLSASTGALRIRLQDRNTGKALAGIPVRVELRDKNKQTVEVGTLRTDEQGTGQPRLQLPDWEDGDYQLRIVANTGWFGGEELTETVKLRRSWKLLLTSDKPVYQPGQSIRVRSLTLRKPDLKPVMAREALFSITDPKGNVVFKRSDVTSKFGIAAIDCPLASEIIEGPYTIACKVGDTDSKLRVEVKKYVLPKFKVDLTLEQSFYQPGQRVRGKLQANYFYGKPVGGAQVQLEVENLSSGGRVVPDIQTVTDPNGHAQVEFLLPESLAGTQQDGGARIGLLATVTDSAGQKETRATTSIVSTEVLRIEAIPEAGTLVSGMANRVYVVVAYPDGQPAAQARLLVSGQEREMVTNDLGVAAVELATNAASTSLTIKATDAKGQVGRRQVVLTSGQIAQDFLIRTNKAVYNGGDTVHLAALGGGVDPVYVDLLKDGQTMLTQAVSMANGRGDFSFDLPAEVFGTVELVAYRLSTTWPIRKTRVLYVRPAGQVVIAAKLDRQEYRPGDKARLKIALTDAEGKPAPGAVSLSAVDEAVFAVLAQRPGMEGTFYSIEQRLLKPVYEIYPWSPDLGTGKDKDQCNELEQALFSRTAKTLTDTGKNGPHSLTGSSFLLQRKQVDAVRQSGLDHVTTGWLVFFGLLVAAGLVHLLATHRPWEAVENYFEGLEERSTARTGYPIVSSDIEVPDHRESSRGRPSEQAGISVVGCLVALMGTVVVCLFAIQILGKNANSAFGTVGASIGATVSGGSPVATMERNFDPQPRAEVVKTVAPPILTPVDTPKAEPKTEPEEPAAPPRIREFFPETLLWRPELITDDKGHASLDIDLADSITTWRLSASAVTADGRLGAVSEAVRVFQPFFVDLNLPVALTRGDEVGLPVVVSSYLDKPQSVTLELKAAAWFALLDGEAAVRTVDLKPGEKVAVKFPIKVRQVGPQQPLTVEARGKQMSDAVRRVVEVVPDGQKVERVVNGTLVVPVDQTFTVPANAIEGSPKLILKVYPSSFSQLVEGLDNIFRMPSGCFEQTSSTTYPNVLALDYLRRTGKSVPAVEAKARQFIHLGYQRLLSFEVPGGGFDWFGRSPANRTLTAYGLMEFADMAKVHDVDPNLIDRTRNWLLKQQGPNGSWSNEGGMLNDGLAGSVQRGNDPAYSTTAYIAWAVFDGRPFDARAAQARQYLVSLRPNGIDDAYVLALTSNALFSIDEGAAAAYIEVLHRRKKVSADGKLTWWEQSAGGRTTFYGAGQSGNVETTALAALALLRSGQHSGTARSALAWLAQQKDANGTWYSTQATVLALKALVAGTGKSAPDGQARQIKIALGNGVQQTLTIPPEQSEVMQQVDLSAHLVGGDQQLKVSETTGGGAGYQIAFRYHVPQTDRASKDEPLAIDLVYDRTELSVNDTLKVTATVRNRLGQTAPMVMLDLPIPAGFALVPDALNELVEKGVVARYQVTGRQVLVYLRGLDAGKSLTVPYQLRATMPVRVTVPAGRAYEYYDPSKQGHSAGTRLTVTSRP